MPAFRSALAILRLLGWPDGLDTTLRGDDQTAWRVVWSESSGLPGGPRRRSEGPARSGFLRGSNEPALDKSTYRVYNLRHTIHLIVRFLERNRSCFLERLTIHSVVNNLQEGRR